MRDETLSEDQTYRSQFADYVALVYHEARNVRHLIRAGVEAAERWKYVVALDVKRDKAWVSLQRVRLEAKAAGNAAGVLRAFERRFRVSLPQLVELYGHPAWRNEAYGGNAWKAIAQLVQELAQYLEANQSGDAGKIFEALLVARHNTGLLSDKLARLDATLHGQHTVDGV